jgi:hypothetical protein
MKKKPAKKEIIGGTRKIGDISDEPNIWKNTPKDICYHPEHNPPSMRVYFPGIYEHICPGCGHRFVFTIYPHHMVMRKDYL